jgi:hypothetical protein
MSGISTIDAFGTDLEPVCGAQALFPSDRQAIGLHALAGDAGVSELARQHQVSRKFVYQQKGKAATALETAFESPADDERVLFELPVTKTWLRQVVLCLMLICHSSMRGVIEFFAAVLDQPIGLGTVHRIMQESVVGARQVLSAEDLSAIRAGAHDEIFQGRRPILVGCDVDSTYCYLLAPEAARDATTWGVHLLDLEDKGLRPDHIIADWGKGLRAAQEEVWPDIPCRGNLFHAMQALMHLVTYVDNHAFGTMTACEQLEQQMERAKRNGRGNTLSKKLAQARQAQHQAIQLADDIGVLVGWLRQDIFAVVGPELVTRQTLYDWIIDALKDREAHLPHRIRPVCTLLENHREDLLAFVVPLDQQLVEIARQRHLDPKLVRTLFELQTLAPEAPTRIHQEEKLRSFLGIDFQELEEQIHALMDTTVRASSIVENLNSRLRSYFFLKKQLGTGYLDLLRFFLNHRRFLRSEHPERVGRSPAELLTGQEHPHWLELLGFERFKKRA